MTRDFDGFLDSTMRGRQLKCTYHGNEDLHLEARILSDTASEMVVGVNLFDEDVASWIYDDARASLDIWYRPPAPGTMRIMLLPNAEFGVPKDIREINLYDVGQAPERAAEAKRSRKK